MDNILISSTEELSPEDRLLLASKRQEPQGEEHASCTLGDAKGKAAGGVAGLTSNALQRTKAKLPAVSSDSESDCSDDDGIVYQNVGGLCSSSNSNSLSSSRSGHVRSSGGANACNLSTDSNSNSTYNTLIIHHNNNSLLANTWIPASHEFTSLATGSNRNSSCSNSRKSQSPCKDIPKHGAMGPAYEALKSDSANHELSDIPRDYLNQLTVLKHLAKEVQQDPISDPPNSKLLRSASFSRSQPDLSQSTPMAVPTNPSSHSYYYGPPPPQLQHYQSQVHAPRKKKFEEDVEVSNLYSNSSRDDGIPSTSVQMLEILMRENSNLRAELANARMRIQTIHKLESELTRLQKQHAALFESAERRESLERTARAKLSTEVKRLTAVNRELMSSSNSLQNLSSYSLGSDVEAYRKELAKKDMTISQLLTQNKELTTQKERQEIELTAQRATLEEQRTHIDILDSALTTAQQNVVRLEEECRRNQEYAEKVAQLQRALSSLQLYNEKREQSEKKLRSQLESEITELKLQLASKNAKSNLTNTRGSPVQNGSTNSSKRNPPPPYPGPGSQGNADITPELQILQEKLRMSEDKILSLTSVVQRWENYFSIEGQGDKTPLSTTSTPNTPNSFSSRGGTPHFFANSASSSNGALDDLPTTQNRATDLEWKIKDLESRLVEKDNMLRALNYQNVPPVGAQAPYSSYGSNSTYVSSGYRESPGYSAAAIIHPPIPINIHNPHKPHANHQVSVSLASMMDSGCRYVDPMLFYEKVGKCESEPPSYANLPPKLRLGGSGSSLAKNSNESLGSAGLSSGNGMSNNASEPESVSSEGSNAKSIDEQLKELNTQLLSKGATGLKTQSSGLCCIPGFTNPSTTTRKGKIPQPLLEGVSNGNSSGSDRDHLRTSGNPPYKKSVLPPLPRPPQSVSSQSQQQSSRTSSGPPFISPSGSNSALDANSSSTVPLSNSVDSILSPESNGKGAPGPGSNVFTPVTNLPKGLPPKSPSGVADSSKCKSLERDQKSKSSNESSGNVKLTGITYDTTASRCKSLDRREMKAQAKEEKEKKTPKSTVSSKAAFFGGLLTRRSPSPARKAKDKETEKTESKVPVGHGGLKAKFPFGRSQQNPSPSLPQDNISTSDQEIDTDFLDMQGRSSQRSRISKLALSVNNVGSACDLGKDSPWVQRRSGSGGDSLPVSRKQSLDNSSVQTFEGQTEGEVGKKWGKIVKSPFGLRYTFGSPRS